MRRAAALAAGFALAACGPDLATRYETGNRALSHGDGAMYAVVILPRLRDALDACIPRGTPGAATLLVVVADIDARGAASNVDVEPDSAGTDCLHERLATQQWPRPPLHGEMQSFPIGLKIETR